MEICNRFEVIISDKILNGAVFSLGTMLICVSVIYPFLEWHCEELFITDDEDEYWMIVHDRYNVPLRMLYLSADHLSIGTVYVDRSDDKTKGVALLSS